MENKKPSSSKLLKSTMGDVFPPSSMPESIRIHDVFLSFRGKDTRASFTSHLYAALLKAGINIFMDDNELQRGDHISSSLSRAIEQSKISIIVFSKNYADSRWCLNELVKIMKCRKTIGQVVVPVFYHVDPSEVRNQRGEFGRAFQCLFNRISNEVKLVQSWRKALREAANIAGFVILNSRNESEDVKGIADNISHLLNKTDLFIANNPVGIESRVQDVIQLLHIRPNGVLLLGMWGMGGIGKTTIAKAIYNKIGRTFEGRSFLASIRENGEKIAGLVGLQEQLLFDICKETTIKIPNIESGKSMLKNKLNHTRVLIVLDDVNTLDQLNTFCASREWFGSGSIIIITTRDMQLLKGRVDKIYKMPIMNESESIELFSWNAFEQSSPPGDFVRISRSVVEYSGGLPLALEVLGSYLFGKTESEWELVLEKLKRIPNDQVQKKLRISYDGLDDDEKEIFLDTACFFIGMDRNDVIHILNDCGLSAELGINVLVEKSLVTVDDKNMLGMHGQLRDMGRGIIHDESPRRPEKRSRLWFREDVIKVLSIQTGKKCVLGMALKLPTTKAKCFSTKAFEKMKRLRLLQLAGVQLDGDFEYVSRDLKWLSWNGLSQIPTNFYGENLVSIELENSNIELLWKKTMRMEKLKILNLSHSHYLTECPDFSNMPNLEKLLLKDCPLLSEVSPSIEHLNKILLINLEDCISLCSLPRNIYKLKSLKTLILSGCLKIDKLEEDLEQMKSLATFLANNTAITRVPLSKTMENLKNINLSHSHCLTNIPDFSCLPNLEKLVIKDCPMLSEVSPGIEHLKKILLISLEDCIGLRNLPRSIYKLKSLETFILSGCLKIDKLEEDLEQMESLTTLLANNTAIRRVPFSVVRSKSIKYISLCGYEGSSHDMFPSIIWSWMSPTNNLLARFQICNHHVSSNGLVYFDIQHCSPQKQSFISSQFSRLRSLWIQCCSELQLSEEAELLLDALHATNCKEAVSNMTTSTLIQCCSEVYVSGSKHPFNSLLIQMGMNCQVTDILKEIILQNMNVNGSGDCFLPGDSYPNWFTYNSEGSSVTFEVPKVEGRNLKTVMCIVYSSTPENTTSEGLKCVLVKNYTKATIQLYKSEALVSFEDEEGQRVVSSIEPGNKVEVVVVFENDFTVKKTTVYLVYDEPIGEKMELYHVPDLNDITCKGDENECSDKRFSTEEDPTDDFRFNQNRKKKNRVE